MTEKDISGLNNKVENEGVSKQGRLSADEFNLLVDATIELQEKMNTYFTPLSEAEYDDLVDKGKVTDRPYFVYEE